MKTNTTRYLPHACALLISFFTLQGSAAAQATVYADVNFSGSSQTLNGDVPNMIDAGFNDAISSIRIPSGEQWQFCQDVNFQGSCQTIQGSIADLRRINWNDRISSMRRVDGGYRNRPGDPYYGRNDNRYGDRFGNGITIFNNPNFGGRRASFNNDVPDLRQVGFNDQVTSLEVPRGETWEICVDVDYQGVCQTVSGSVTDLRRMGWNDRISSMRRVSGANYRGRRNDNRNDGLVFYNQPNFRGASTFVVNGSQVGMNARRGSVQVRGGGAWRLCDQNGACTTIERDVNNVAELGLNGRITSVREVSQGRRWNPFGR